MSALCSTVVDPYIWGEVGRLYEVGSLVKCVHPIEPWRTRSVPTKTQRGVWVTPWSSRMDGDPW